MVGFCLPSPASRPADALPPQPHDRRPARAIATRGIGRMLEARSSARKPSARHQTDRVDLRSARAEERLLQHRAPRRDRPPLRPESVRRHREPSPRRTAHRPLHRRVASRLARASSASWPASASSRTPSSALRSPPTSPASAPRTSPAPARSSSASEKFLDRLRPRPRRHRLRAIRRPTGPTSWTMAMRLDRIVLRQIRMPLVHFFETSFGRTYERDIILVEVQWRRALRLGRGHRRREPLLQRGVDRLRLADPQALRRAARPRHATSTSAADVAPLTKHIRGHQMARGGLETAVWDLEARRDGVPLWQQIGGGARREIPCGVSIGVQDSVDQLLDKIRDGARCRLPAHQDEDQARLGRRRRSPRSGERFPAIKLMADANSAYTLADIDRSEAARRVQPDDDRAAARARRHHRPCRAASVSCKPPSASTSASASRTTPSRRSSCAPAASSTSSSAASAASPKRSASTTSARRAGIPVWCGGMLEAGIGRAHNIALATLPNFVLPGDVSASKRYWKQDIIAPAVETTPERHDRSSATTPASATTSTTTSSNRSPSAKRQIAAQ